MRTRLGALIVAGIVAAFVVPLFSSGAELDRVAMALALAGVGAGTALAAAAGRPLLAAATLSGVGAYVSAIASLHQVAVPIAVLLGCAGGVAAGALIALIGSRLDGLGFLLVTLLIALAAGAAVQATPGITGAGAGLGPIPQLEVPLSGARAAVLTPVGDFQLLVIVALVVIVVAANLLAAGPGPRWRAVGSDRVRAAASGLHPLLVEVTVVAVCGALAALCGALAAHISEVATPGSFAVDVAALPLLAAVAARNDPFATALLAVGTGLVQQAILPALGWQGPPSAQAVALGALALAAIAAVLLARRPVRELPAGPGVDPGASWPFAGLGLRGTTLTVDALTVRSRRGAVLVDAPGFTVPSGHVHALVGPNGAGKTTLLRTLAAQRGRARGAAGERVVLLPQEGGGFANCTVRETLALAAAFGRRRATARAVAAAWIDRLGLDGVSGRRCAELSAGQRRLVDLARVLLVGPTVLLCDEPLAGLDDNQRAAAVACLAAAAEAGLTIVVTEHDRDAVSVLAGSVTELVRATP